MSKTLFHFGGPTILRIGSASLRKAPGGYKQSCHQLAFGRPHRQSFFGVGLKDSLIRGSHNSGSFENNDPSEFSAFKSWHRTMSWLSRGTSNADLIQQMQSFGAIKSDKVADIMRRIDRGLFVPPSEEPYQDAPQPIGFNATISAPHMHAHCLELLEEHLKPGAKALDVGSGTGYLTACMALMIEDGGGRAIGVEHIKELTEKSIENISNSAAGPLLERGTIELHTGDGRQGWPAHAPFDAIHVGAAAEDTPKELLNQLKPGGRLVCPVGNFLEQYLMVYDKADDGSVREHVSSGVRYVPLTDESAQRKPRGIFG